MHLWHATDTWEQEQVSSSPSPSPRLSPTFDSCNLRHIAALGFFIIAAAKKEPVHFLDCLGVSIVRMIEADLDEVKIKEKPESPAASGNENNPPKRHRGPKATKFGRAKEPPLVLE